MVETCQNVCAASCVPSGTGSQVQGRVVKAIYDPRYRAMVARLRDARMNAGLTQANVARKMGRCRTWVAKIESCELECGLLDLIRFCRVYELEIREVIELMEKAP